MSYNQLFVLGEGKKKYKAFLPTFIVFAYLFFVFLEIIIIFWLLDIDWHRYESFFSKLGLIGSVLRYPLVLAEFLAINPIIAGLGLMEDVNGFVMFRVPSLVGTLLNLPIILFVTFILNYIVVKVVRKKGQKIET